MEDYRKLIEEYKSKKGERTQQESAKLERRIWDAALPTMSKTDGSLLSKREFLAKELDETPHAVEARSALLGYGDVIDGVWERVETKRMPIRTAVNKMREAKHRARATGEDFTLSVETVLDEYESLPSARLPDGTVIHRRNPGALPRSAMKDPEPHTERGSDPKLFWQNLRGMISGYFHTRLEGLDQGVIEKAWREMDIDLKVLLEQFQRKIDRMRHDGEGLKHGANRGKILSACHALHLDPPPPSKPLGEEFKKRAKKQFKKLAAAYHPDSGTDNTRDLYESVVEAYRFLEDL